MYTSIVVLNAFRHTGQSRIRWSLIVLRQSEHKHRCRHGNKTTDFSLSWQTTQLYTLDVDLLLLDPLFIDSLWCIVFSLVFILFTKYAMRSIIVVSNWNIMLIPFPKFTHIKSALYINNCPHQIVLTIIVEINERTFHIANVRHDFFKSNPQNYYDNANYK